MLTTHVEEEREWRHLFLTYHSGLKPRPAVRGRTVAGRDFEVEVRSTEDPVRLVPVGELDIATTGYLRQVVRAHERSAGSVVLDLTELDFIDMAGLRAVAEERDRASREGYGLRVLAGRGAARRLIELTGVPEVFAWAAD